MEKLNRAIKFAVDRHDGQRRKLGNTPYILHPLEALAIASDLTDDEDTLVAVVLHDTVEDTATTMDEIRDLFGDRVAQLVAAETENKYPQRSAADTWMRRKMETLKGLEQTTDYSVKVMWLADKLSNVRALWKSHRAMGDDIWQAFNQKDKSKVKWYYDTVVRYLRDTRFPVTAPMDELAWLVNDLFKEV